MLMEKLGEVYQDPPQWCCPKCKAEFDADELAAFLVQELSAPAVTKADEVVSAYKRYLKGKKLKEARQKNKPK